MKKSILAIAVAATIAAPAAIAAPTVYGNVNLSLDAFDNDIVGADNNITMHSNTSAIGLKGSEDLGDGLKAIYKVEFGINLLGPPTPEPDTAWDGRATPEGTGALGGRDQFIGLKGGWGTVKLGVFSSNYKQMGGKVDPLYRTPLEGRGFLDIQSPLHRGRGINNGRMTNAASYTTPKMGGFSLVANTTFSGSNDETTGIGIRWSNKAFMAYADWIDFQIAGDATGPDLALAVKDCTVANFCAMGTAIKVGGKFTAKAFSIALQYETIDTGEWKADTDLIFLAGTWNINKNNALILTAGTQDIEELAGDTSEDSTGVALAYNHKMSKMTNVYVGYGAKSSDQVADASRTSYDESVVTAGMRVKF